MAAEIRTDEQIQQDVLAELRWDARVQPNEIGVSVKNGVVTLTGSVDAYLKKWAAEEAAHRVRGVKAVANDIEVRISGAAQRTDADIAAAAVRALEADAFLSTDKVHVTVSKGWVTLEGEVEWQFEKEDAERVVRRLAGVKGVTNLISFLAEWGAHAGPSYAEMHTFIVHPAQIALSLPITHPVQLYDHFIRYQEPMPAESKHQTATVDATVAAAAPRAAPTPALHSGRR